MNGKQPKFRVGDRVRLSPGPAAPGPELAMKGKKAVIERVHGYEPPVILYDATHLPSGTAKDWSQGATWWYDVGIEGEPAPRVTRWREEWIEPDL